MEYEAHQVFKTSLEIITAVFWLIIFIPQIKSNSSISLTFNFLFSSKHKQVMALAIHFLHIHIND
jgi:hypothetical protein